MSPFLRYTLLRLALLAGAGGVLWLVGLRGLPWALVTVVVAGVAAYLLLAGPREAVVRQWSQRAEERGAGAADARRRRARQVSDEEVEDGALDDTAFGDRPLGDGAADGPGGGSERG